MAIINDQQIRIAIVGKSRSGKDFVADAIADYYQEQGLSVIKKSFASGIKQLYKQHFQGLGATSKPRDAYITIGEAFRSIDPTVWIRQLKKEIDYSYAWDVVIITDLRRVNEADFALEEGFTLLKVTADDAVRVSRSKSLGEKLNLLDVVDDEVDRVIADVTIDTNNNPSKEVIINLLEQAQKGTSDV